MNYDEYVTHLRKTNQQGFYLKFKREMRIDLGVDLWLGYRLFLRGFSMWEIKDYIYGY